VGGRSGREEGEGGVGGRSGREEWEGGVGGRSGREEAGCFKTRLNQVKQVVRLRIGHRLPVAIGDHGTASKLINVRYRSN